MLCQARDTNNRWRFWATVATFPPGVPAPIVSDAARAILRARPDRRTERGVQDLEVSWSDGYLLRVAASGDITDGCGPPRRLVPEGGTDPYEWNVLGPPTFVRYLPAPAGTDPIEDGLTWWILVPDFLEFFHAGRAYGEEGTALSGMELAVAVAVRPLFASPRSLSRAEVGALVRSAFPRELGPWTENVWMESVLDGRSTMFTRWTFEWRALKHSLNAPIEWHEETLSHGWDARFPETPTPRSQQATRAVYRWAFPDGLPSRMPRSGVGVPVPDPEFDQSGRVVLVVGGKTDARQYLAEWGACMHHMASRMDAYVGYGAGALIIRPRRGVTRDQMLMRARALLPVEYASPLARSHMPEETGRIVKAVAVHLPVEGVPETIAAYADESALVISLS